VISPRLIAYGIGALAIALLAWRVNAWHNAYKELPVAKAATVAAENALTAQREQAAKDAAIAAKVSGELATLRGKEAEIVTKIVSIPRKELVYVKVPGECPVRSDSFRLLYNEAVTGSSAEPSQ
jgi:hypothetical protein